MAMIQQDDELYNILRCPVCLEVPKAFPIRQCDRGHHICESCFCKIRECRCPICKANYYGTRNYIAEELIKFFPNLRIVSFETTPTEIKLVQDPEVQLKAAPALCRGIFPCRFNGCTRSLGAGRMLQHMRHYHRHSLIEVGRHSKYSQAWDLEFALDVTLTEAIRISNMGLFFFVLNIDVNGLVCATVQMVASEQVASLFKFKIKVLDKEKKSKITFADRVHSCRDTFKHLSDYGHCLEFNANKVSGVKQDGLIVCSVTITDERK